MTYTHRPLSSEANEHLWKRVKAGDDEARWFSFTNNAPIILKNLARLDLTAEEKLEMLHNAIPEVLRSIDAWGRRTSYCSIGRYINTATLAVKRSKAQRAEYRWNAAHLVTDFTVDGKETSWVAHSRLPYSDLVEAEKKQKQAGWRIASCHTLTLWRLRRSRR